MNVRIALTLCYVGALDYRWTKIAYNLLRNLGSSFKVTHLITVGSPLAVTPVKQALAPLGRPEGLKSWSNARDSHDVVALFL